MPETPTKVRAPIVELVIVRTKEFLRETEAIFWVFGFPLLLALALGFAFRAKAPDKIPIGVTAGPHAQQQVATPMRKSHYILSFFLGRMIWLIIEVVVLVAFGWLVFGVRVNGSVALLTLVCLVGGYGFSGLGLMLASRVKTIEAISGLMNLVMVPMWICSGVFFSYERFPDAVKPLIRALPLTALNDALRAVINDAASAAQIAPQLAILAAWGIVGFFVGIRIFKWQ